MEVRELVASDIVRSAAEVTLGTLALVIAVKVIKAAIALLK